MHRRDILITAAATGVALAASDVRAAPAARRRIRPPFVEARDGTTLFVREWGEGPPVLFVHSWALSSEMWAYQTTALADAGFRCIAFDRRGHGRSDVPPAGYDLDTLADDLRSVIEALDLRDVALVGHSIGCAEILRSLGRGAGGRVSKIALLAPAAPYLVKTEDNAFGAPMSYFQARMAEWSRDFPQWIETNKEPFFTAETSAPMKVWLVNQMLATPAPVAIATFRGVLTHDLRPDLAKVRVPTLILHGTEDASAPLEITGRRVAAGIAQAELKVYQGAPHGLFVAHMTQVNADLLAFLES